MVRIADLPYTARRQYFRSEQIDHRPPDHSEGCRDRSPGGLSASTPPPPPDRPAGYRVHSPSVVVPAYVLPPAPDRHMSPGTSSGRPLRSRRRSDISPVPSPPTRSAQRERYREHHHRARDESSRSRSRSPRLHLPLRGSKSPPSSKPHGLEDGRKGSKSEPPSKRYRLDEGRKGSSSGEHWYDDDERGGSRGRYGDGRHTRELTYPSSCDYGHCYLGRSKRNSSTSDHGKRSFSDQHHSSPRKLPLLIPIEMSPWHDGYKSPSSPTYCCQDELDIGKGTRDDDRDGNCAPDWPDSAFAAYDGSGIAGREPSFKYEDPVFKKKKEDSAYDALIDDFMDAVLKNWLEPVDPDVAVDKEAYQEQTDRFAELALKRYNKNKNNKVKYSLVEAIVSAAIFEGTDLYAHVNFYANAKNGPRKNGPRVLVFAELHQVGQRPNAMALTSFHLLDEKKQCSGRRDQGCSSRITDDKDIYHCYACTDKIKHPEGSCYRAGHFVDMSCYLNDL